MSVRFVYVRASRRKTYHILRGPRVEGGVTDCGRSVTTKWTWRSPKEKVKVCEVCQRA
jgi:hypothetical protein